MILISNSTYADGVISSTSERITAAERIELPSDTWNSGNQSNLKIESGGKDNAAVTFIINTDLGGLNKSYFPYIYANSPMMASASCDLRLSPEKFNNYNQISCMIYPDIPDRAAVWFEISGSGVWTQASRPLRPRQWNKISVCWSNNKPDEARKLKRLTVMRHNAGKLPGDPDEIKFYLKDFTLENVITGTESGWEASPEKIILPQTGFAPHYAKSAILSHTHPADDFSVLRDGKTVFQGKLELKNFATGTFKIADFSRVDSPGTYIIRSGNLESCPFEISYQHMKDLADKNANFLFSMRSGMATPAHPACFLDDCIRSDNKQPVDVSGGWFDASDLRGYHSMAMKTILLPLAISHEFNAPELYSEMLWGGKQINKLFDKETGLPYTVHSLYPKSNPDKRMSNLFTEGNFYKVNNYWTDNIPDTGDERVIHVAKGTYICHPDMLDSHWGMTAAGGYFYLAAEKHDPELAESVLHQSKRHFDFISNSSFDELKNNGIGYYAPYSNVALTLRILNAVAFHRATSEAKYKKLALDLAKYALTHQQLELYQNSTGDFISGFFCDTPKKASSSFNRDDILPYALSQVAAEFPEDGLYFKIHAALRIYADFYLLSPVSRALPYSIPYPRLKMEATPKHFQAGLGISAKGEKLYGEIPDHTFMSGLLGHAALQTQALAVFLNEPRLQEIAASYLSYHTGLNPAGRSFIAEAGSNYRTDQMSSMLGWIPGMLSNPNCQNGFPNLPYNRHFQSNEIYTQSQAGYAVTAALLAAPANYSFSDEVEPVKITDLMSNQAVANTHALPGGTLYRFEFANGLTFDESIVSGAKKMLRIDANNFVKIIDLNVPAVVSSGEAFSATATVYYFGEKSRKVKIEAYCENAETSTSFIEQAMKSGDKADFTFQMKAGKANQPFVFMAFPNGTPVMLKSCSGAVSAKKER